MCALCVHAAVVVVVAVAVAGCAAVTPSTQAPPEEACPPRNSCRQRGDTPIDFIPDPCRCDALCNTYADCCHDAEFRDARLQHIEVSDFRCHALGEYQVYVRVSRCRKGWSDAEVEDLCVGAGVSGDPFSRLPVTSRSTGHTYANYYCAICNEDILDLRMWNVFLQCDLARHDSMGVDDLVFRNNRWGVVRGSPESPDFRTCSLSPEMPRGITNQTRRCSLSTNTCSEDWQDEEVAARCRSYTGVVYYFNGASYRNPHCALCNKERDDYECFPSVLEVASRFPMDRDSPAPFALLFDFTDPSRSNLVGSSAPCNATQVWDPFFKRCRSIVCPKPDQDYRYGRCVTLSDVDATGGSEPPDGPPATTSAEDAATTTDGDGESNSNISNSNSSITSNTTAGVNNSNSNNSTTTTLSTSNTTVGVNRNNNNNNSTTTTISTNNTTDSVNNNSSSSNSNSSSTTTTVSTNNDGVNDNNSSSSNNTINTDATSSVATSSSLDTVPPSTTTAPPPTTTLEDAPSTAHGHETFPEGRHPILFPEEPTEPAPTLRGEETTPAPPDAPATPLLPDTDSATALPANMSAEFAECYRVLLLEGEFIELPNGTVHVREYGRTYSPGEYVRLPEGLLVCLPDTVSSNKFSAALGWVSLAGLGLSCTSLLLHLAAFALLPELRNPSGRNLASLCVALLAAYIALLVNMLARPDPAGCVTLAAAMYYFFVTSFTWMNVIAFDVWYTFRLTQRQLRVSSGAQWRRFVAYSLYSWLLPAAATVALVLVDQLEPRGVPEEFLPRLGRTWCWFSHRKALLVFFAAPMVAIIVMNCFFFVSTAAIITQTGSTVAAASARGNHPRGQYKMYLRLAVLMGFTWVSGVAAGYLDLEALWFVFVVLNTLQGVFIFLAFTFRTRVWQGVGGTFSRLLRRGLSKVTRQPPPPDSRAFELSHTPEGASTDYSSPNTSFEAC